MNDTICSLMIHSCPTVYTPKAPGTLVTLSDREHAGEMWVVPLFDGIYISLNDFHMQAIPVRKSASKNHLLINYCFEGRCEVNLGSDGYVFVDKEFLSIDTHTAKHDFVSPTGRYKGIELIFDFDIFKDQNPAILEAIGLDIRQIRHKFCPDDTSFLAKAPDMIRTIFEETILHYDSLPMLRLLFLRLLYELTVLDKKSIRTKTVFLTKGQTEIAKHTYRIITEQLSKKHSVSRLAHNFGVSESSLRNYFYHVYGESIPSLLRHKRMEQAVFELRSTAKSITEIAQTAGYENQSKFSAAFKRYKGETPMEYRRIERLKEKGGHFYD